MNDFEVSPEAAMDLADILVFVSRDGVDTAERIIDQMYAQMERVAAMPGAGHIHAELEGLNVRVTNVHGWLIVYRPDRRPIQIARVVRGERDLRRLFER